MLRLAPAGAWILALAPLACGEPPPSPSKLADAVSPIQDPPRPAPVLDSPFRPPGKEPPLPRSEPQLPPEAVAAALVRAEEALKIGDEVSAVAALRTCANKVPQHVRCEGELAILLARSPRFKYEADYYLDQVADAPDAIDTAIDTAGEAAYYQRLGEALAGKGRFDDAALAYQRMIDRRASASADDYNLLATMLQAAPNRLHEAAEALRRAYELDPTRHEWLRDRAIILGQTEDKIAYAIELFEQYRTTTRDPDMLAEIARRIEQLQIQIQRLTPTPADPGASAPVSKRAKDPKKPPPLRAP